MRRLFVKVGELTPEEKAELSKVIQQHAKYEQMSRDGSLDAAAQERMRHNVDRIKHYRAKAKDTSYAIPNWARDPMGAPTSSGARGGSAYNPGKKPGSSAGYQNTGGAGQRYSSNFSDADHAREYASNKHYRKAYDEFHHFSFDEAFRRSMANIRAKASAYQANAEANRNRARSDTNTGYGNSRGYTDAEHAHHYETNPHYRKAYDANARYSNFGEDWRRQWAEDDAERAARAAQREAARNAARGGYSDADHAHHYETNPHYRQAYDRKRNNQSIDEATRRRWAKVDAENTAAWQEAAGKSTQEAESWSARQAREAQRRAARQAQYETAGGGYGRPRPGKPGLPWGLMLGAGALGYFGMKAYKNLTAPPQPRQNKKNKPVSPYSV